MRHLLRAGDALIDVWVDGEASSPSSPSSPAIVLLPSSQRDATDLDDFAQRVARQGFRVLRPQPRGMGRSSPPPPDMTLHTLAADVAQTIATLGGGRAIVAGHAFGHFVARVAALNHPALVRGVAVLAGAARTFPPGLSAALDVAADASRSENERLAALQLAFFAPGNDARVWLQGWHPALRSSYRAAAATPPKSLWWPVSAVPILDLQGACDPWRPAETRSELQDQLGDPVTVQVLPQCSHAMLPEQPVAVAAALTAWARRLPA